MEEPEILSATEASRSFSDLLSRVCYGGESFIIKKGHKLMARITPVEEVKQEPVILAPDPAASLKEMLSDDPVPANMTADEAEFYRAWMEQVRKVEA